MSRVAHAINGSFERMFDKLGRLIARRPIIVMINAVFVFAALASGVTRLQNETRCARPSCQLFAKAIPTIVYAGSSRIFHRSWLATISCTYPACPEMFTML